MNKPYLLGFPVKIKVFLSDVGGLPFPVKDFRFWTLMSAATSLCIWLNNTVKSLFNILMKTLIQALSFLTNRDFFLQKFDHF